MTHVSDDPLSIRLSRWIGSWASVIAPASMVSALLFYFGYVSSRAQYAYFGVDVDTIGLGTQDYIMRSPQPLLVPLLVLTLLGSGLLTANNILRKRAVIAVGQAAGARTRRIRRLVRLAIVIGLFELAVGVVLLFLYAAVRNWAGYDLVTPLLITTGGALVAYSSHFSSFLERIEEGRVAAGEAEPRPVESSFVNDPVPPRRMVQILLYILVAASTLWATATIAQWSGRGLAQDTARHLDSLPRVILDTKERLFLRSPDVEETVLPAADGQTFRYRYRNLRLLIVGRDRMFLVPEKWSASNSTLVVPFGDSTRVQFQFQSQPP